MKGVSFSPLEEDLIHHIHEALFIISTGSPLSFYDNPYVRTWLTSLNNFRQPIYRLKPAWLIWCVVGITQKEVISLMCCSFYILFIIYSHVPSFDRYFVLLQNCSFSTVVLLFPQPLIFSGILFVSYQIRGLFTTSCQIITGLIIAYG